MAYLETIQKEILSVPPIEILTSSLVEQMARINGEMNLAEVLFTTSCSTRLSLHMAYMKRNGKVGAGCLG